jgi:hypothetical protein
MQEFLPGSRGPQIPALIRHDPWQLLTAVLVAVSIVITLVFGKRRASSGDVDIGGCDFGDGDGGACGGD